MLPIWVINITQIKKIETFIYVPLKLFFHEKSRIGMVDIDVVHGANICAVGGYRCTVGR